ncbi:hypothetical protein LPJ60_006193, partial [Coemansia sp. RSA 2675]
MSRFRGETAEAVSTNEVVDGCWLDAVNAERVENRSVLGSTSCQSDCMELLAKDEDEYMLYAVGACLSLYRDSVCEDDSLPGQRERNLP